MVDVLHLIHLCRPQTPRLRIERIPSIIRVPLLSDRELHDRQMKYSPSLGGYYFSPHVYASL